MLSLPALPDLLITPVIEAALREDLGRAGDVTGLACIPPEARMEAAFIAREAGVLAGAACIRLTVLSLDPKAEVRFFKADGEALSPGDVIATIAGNARALLSAERVALNLVSHLSGVATLTRRYVEAVAGTRARIAATRKTLPGLRALQKYAVRCGGGDAHRYGLDDAILIKDNHIAVCGGVEAALRHARAVAGHLMKVEIEVDRLDQFEAVLPFRPDVIMLDNFALADLRTAVDRLDAFGRGSIVLEASGGVNLETVGAIAATGVDVISVGALTHSVKVFDIGLDAGLPA
ncbi:MAG: carboxylating nicotinate-nucleotide diphosphorylase [Asticcacaulis sp.]